jgi:release factor glutamine methyltransferase
VTPEAATRADGTIGAALAAAALRLAAAGVDTPRLDARVLLAHVLGEAPEGLSVHARGRLDAAAAARFAAALARRERREPVAYIVGAKEFWSLRFAVSSAALIPRPDSETLIEAALGLFPDRAQALRVLDLGTGTGCLLLSFLHERPQARGVGMDASTAALALAAENAAALGLAGRATFCAGDWAKPVWGGDLAGGFDLVLCNPPYIPSADIAELAPEVRDHEPHAALAAGEDGLDAFRVLRAVVPTLLTASGMAVFEVGAGQSDAAESCLICSSLQPIARRRDLAGIERALILGRAQAPGEGPPRL